MTRKRVLGSICALMATVCLHGITPADADAASQGTINSLAIDSGAPATIYAATSDRGVLKSIDGGATWTVTGLTNGGVGSITIAPTTPITLFATTYPGGLLRSRDEGATWTAIAPGLSIGRVLIDPQIPTSLYAVASARFEDDPDAGVLKSTDGGDTWALSLANVTLPLWNSVETVAMARPDLTTSGIVYAGVWYGSPAQPWGYVMRSTDGGTTWEFSQGNPYGPFSVWPGLAVDFMNPDSVYGWDDRLRKSPDRGATWTATGLTDVVYTMAIDRRLTTTVYAATDNGASKSTDSGWSWASINSGLTNVLAAYGIRTDVLDLALDPATPATVYAATRIGVFKTTDAGANWSPTGLFQQSPLAAVAFDPDRVIGGHDSAGTITLVNAAPEGGLTVSLTSTAPAIVAVPETVTIPGGLNSVTFTVSTSPAAGFLGAYVMASLGDATRAAWLSITPTVVLASVSVNPSTIAGGQTVTGTVSLTGAAPASGALVSLFSDNPAVATVVGSVAVAEGSTTADFTIFTASVSAATTVQIRGDLIVSRSAALTVTPATSLISVNVNPSTVASGSTATGTVLLSGTAPPGGAVIGLSSSNPAAAMIPDSVTVHEGATSANFAVSTASCTAASVTISAVYANISKSALLDVVPTGDAVAVQRAEYFQKRQQLRVTATSSHSSAELRVFVTASGVLIGTLRRTGGGSYSGDFTWPVNPQSISVRSSLCGSASIQVATK
jgi:hypothetical protein